MTISITFELKGVTELEHALHEFAAVHVPQAYEAAITELGLFIEREAKTHAPVRTGRLRASIGHSSAPAGGGDGIWEITSQGAWSVVLVGTNVEYAPYMEHGFTMSTGHVAFIDGVGFRYIYPFTFRGYHFMQKAADAASTAAKTILERNIAEAMRKAGFT